jgi:polysaccharide biosynthesis protein PelF
VLMFVGDGSERALIEATADRLGVREQVRVTGLVSDVSMYHPTLALFSLSSHSEGTSISLLEAMSAGVCPVVTDVGGNRACLGASLDHRLVPARDPAALAAAWLAALRDAGRRAVDARAARAHVERHFALRRTVARYMELYDSLSTNERAVSMGLAEIAHA